jgi:hypothetical protein
MTAIIIFALCFFICWFAFVFIEWRRDRRFKNATRNPLHENWRQVPPPNWASRRGTQDYW